MNITLADVLELEPRLGVVPDLGRPMDGTRATAREVSWAVSARGMPPHLPQLRGGELVLVPARVAAALGGDLPALLREAAARGASAVVLDRGLDAPLESGATGEDPIYLEWDGPLGPETETAINRLLTECRGDLYRIGSELERSLTDVAVGGSGLEALVRAVANATDLPLTVRGGSGRVLIAAGADDPAGSGTAVERRLPGNAILRIGPAAPPLSIVARFFADRIASAATAAMQRDDASRPRGSRRAEAMARLLAPERATESERRTLALALGLDPDGLYLVAISRGASESAVARAMSPVGTVLPAGEDVGFLSTVIAVDHAAGEHLGSRSTDAKRRWLAAAPDAERSLALSAPAVGVAGLPAAAAEARFVAEFQHRSPAAPRAASIDSVSDVGPLRLLFPLRETNALRQFVAEALGPLLAEDSRGVLRVTLTAFLDSGGSQVDAAERLGIHRNTLTYRLRRMGAILGREVTDPESWLTLRLALLAADVLDICSDMTATGGRP